MGSGSGKGKGKGEGKGKGSVRVKVGARVRGHEEARGASARRRAATPAQHVEQP